MFVEKGSDDLCLGEKFQSSSEIAGSHRNSLGASVEEKRVARVEH